MEVCSSRRATINHMHTVAFLGGNTPKQWSRPFSTTIYVCGDTNGNVEAGGLGSSPLMRRSWWTPGHFWTQPQSEIRLLWAFPVQLLRSPQMEIAWSPVLNYFRYEKLSPCAQLSPVAVCAHCLLPPCCTDLRTARSFSLTCPSAHPARGWHPNLRCLLLPNGWGFQPQQRSRSEMNGTRGMCWAVLKETLAAITTQRQRRNIFQVIFSVCHLSLPDSQGIFLFFCTIYEFGVSSHTLPHGLLWSSLPLPFIPFFLPFLSYLWPSLRESLWSIKKLAENFRSIGVTSL